MKFKNPFSPNTKKTSPSRMRAISAAIFIGSPLLPSPLLLTPQGNQRPQPLLAQVKPEPEHYAQIRREQSMTEQRIAYTQVRGHCAAKIGSQQDCAEYRRARNRVQHSAG